MLLCGALNAWEEMTRNEEKATSTAQVRCSFLAQSDSASDILVYTSTAKILFFDEAGKYPRLFHVSEEKRG